MLNDLVINRKEFQDWDNNLSWSYDGTLFLATYPDLIAVDPLYSSPSNKADSRSLFRTRQLDLSYENKFELITAEQNVLLNAQPISHGRFCQSAPLSPLLSVLTSNGNVNIFNGTTLVANLDYISDDISLQKVGFRTYHSFTWSETENLIAVGNEMGYILIFEATTDNSSFELVKVVDLGMDHREHYVTHLTWSRNFIMVGLSDNSILYLLYTKDENPITVLPIKGQDRFKLSHIRIIYDYAIATATGHVYKFDFNLKELFVLECPIYSPLYIIPLRSSKSLILLSSQASYRMDLLKDELEFLADDVVSPLLEKRLKKWCIFNNESNRYDSEIIIYGVALSPDNYSVAVAYSIERVTIRYRISSEIQYRVMFIPLSDEWKISNLATGLAWYQTYHIYNMKLPIFEIPEEGAELSKKNYDTNCTFPEYLSKFLYNNSQLHNLQFLNFIDDKPSIGIFRSAVYLYACEHVNELDNSLDKACVQSIASVLDLPSPLEAGIVEMQGDYITEAFDFTGSNDSGIINSTNNHKWKRCFITLLPILSASVLICPVTKKRMINIKKDKNNEYGWFTRTLLENLSQISLFTGTTMSFV